MKRQHRDSRDSSSYDRNYDSSISSSKYDNNYSYGRQGQEKSFNQRYDYDRNQHRGHHNDRPSHDYYSSRSRQHQESYGDHRNSGGPAYGNSHHGKGNDRYDDSREDKYHREGERQRSRYGNQARNRDGGYHHPHSSTSSSFNRERQSTRGTPSPHRIRDSILQQNQQEQEQQQQQLHSRSFTSTTTTSSSSSFHNRSYSGGSNIQSKIPHHHPLPSKPILSTVSHEQRKSKEKQIPINSES